VLPARELLARGAALRGHSVRVAGLCICRQRPPTAGGLTFVSLEDETGFANLIVPPAVARRDRDGLRATIVLGTGRVEFADGVVNVKAERLESLDGRWPLTACSGTITANAFASAAPRLRERGDQLSPTRRFASGDQPSPSRTKTNSETLPARGPPSQAHSTSANPSEGRTQRANKTTSHASWRRSGVRHRAPSRSSQEEIDLGRPGSRIRRCLGESVEHFLWNRAADRTSAVQEVPAAQDPPAPVLGGL